MRLIRLRKPHILSAGDYSHVRLENGALGLCTSTHLVGLHVGDMQEDASWDARHVAVVALHKVSQ